MSSVQIAQFVPQFHHGTMHVRLYRADIQIEKRPDLFQAQIVVVPQRKSCSLSGRQPIQRCFQTPMNLPGEITVLSLRPGGAVSAMRRCSRRVARNLKAASRLAPRTRTACTSTSLRPV